MQEPDIKNGVGGLRDYHVLRWFARLLGKEERGIGGLVHLGYLSREEADETEKAYSQLLRIRNELHFQSRREDDVLSLEKQPAVAVALGCKGGVWTKQIEELMRSYYKAAAGILQNIREVEWRFEELREAERAAKAASNMARMSRPCAPVPGGPCPVDSAPIPFAGGFLLRRGFLSAAHPDIFKHHPAQLMRVFRLAQEYNVTPDFPLLRLVRENIHRLTRRVAESPEVVNCFFSILADAGRVGGTLARMYESGVLTRFLPEFAGIHCLVQREIFHRYTVDVHTLLCIRELDAVFRAATPDAERYRTALLDTDEPALLYLVLLLHDIGKRFGVARHAETGAALADKILRRLKLRATAREEAVALIRGHLDMSSFWQKHDLDDPANLDAFAQKVVTAQRLRYLYVLTYCDARATSPDLWNDYKNSLHRQLFRGTLARFEQQTQEAMLRRENVEKTLAGEIATEELDAHFTTVPERYFEQHTEEDVVLHVRLVNQKLRTLTSALGDSGLSPCVHWAQDGETGVSAVTIVTWDREGLFYKLAGAFAVSGLSILRSKAFVRTDGIAIDTFWIEETPDTVKRDKLPAAERFARAAEDALVQLRDHEGDIRKRAAATEAALPKREKLRHAGVPATPQVSVYQEEARHRTVVGVKMPDRTGLLYFLSRLFFQHRFNIIFAGISTEAGVAGDTFYLEPFSGESDKTPEQLAALRSAIEAMV